VAGRLAIVEIVRPRLLEAVGDNGFRLPDLAAPGYNLDEIFRMAPGEVPLVQNQALETSHVSIEGAMTDMIITQRADKLHRPAIATADQMQGLINQLRKEDMMNMGVIRSNRSHKRIIAPRKR